MRTCFSAAWSKKAPRESNGEGSLCAETEAVTQAPPVCSAESGLFFSTVAPRACTAAPGLELLI